MLTSTGCLSRRERLWKLVPPETEWLLVADPRHVHYLANFWVNPIGFSAGERGLLLLDRARGATLLADNFSLISTTGRPYVDEIIDHQWYDHRRSVGNRDEALFDALRQVAGRLNHRPGLMEKEWLPAAAAEVATAAGGVAGAISLGGVLRHMRRQKDPDELDLLIQAIRATEAGHARALEIVRPGLTEAAVYREVQAAAIARLGRPAIIYGDFRALNPTRHEAGGLPTDYVLDHGDLFVLDYSVVVDGYRSDFTNAIAVGHPTDDQRRFLELCLAGMAAGEQVLRAGTLAKDVHAATAQPLHAAVSPAAFWHHAGHGIGLGHPEPPILVPDSDDVLLAGDVLTLEPGLYVADVGGIRIENNYLITAGGYEKLSQHKIALA